MACGGECRIEKKSVQIEGFFSKGKSLQVSGCWFQVFSGFVRV